MERTEHEDPIVGLAFALGCGQGWLGLIEGIDHQDDRGTFSRVYCVKEFEAVPVPRMRAMAVAAAGAAEDALPVEAGRTTVTVNVGGSIQMTQ